MTRRQVLQAVAASVPAAMTQSAEGQTSAAGPVPLHWLDRRAPFTKTGIAWGVPWPRGAVQKTQSFALAAADGTPFPLQAWPLAYWPDGSVKWTGFATLAGPSASSDLTLTPGPARTSGPSVQVRETASAIEIDTGAVKCTVPRQGGSLVESLIVDGRTVGRDARLACTVEDRSEQDTIRRVAYRGWTSKSTVEQSGPVRAVVKLEGKHRAEKGGREWLPFTVRLYFYAGSPDIRVVHTIVFDGDDEKDFISGLGLTLAVPMREQAHNRHVRFSGEGDGLWAEPVQPATGRARLAFPGRTDLYTEQVAGKRLPNKEEFPAPGQKLLNDWAIWDSFKLTQPNADGFTIHKRAHPTRAWIEAGAGKRSLGYAIVGDVSGGVGVAMRNFWQSFPGSLEVQKASTEAAELTAWMWSPDAPAMDLRHYDVKAHDLDSSYEDVQEGFSTPMGIARTSELTLFACASTPAKAESAAHAKSSAEPALLICAPQYLHSVPVLGVWSLPDRSTRFKTFMEDQLDRAVDLYKKEIEQRHWYGFWNYGDIMHAYDPTRHVWRYDIGGFAWDNTELASDMWLWTVFLRSGRADIFRMAEAMTRHTSDVDVYHLGRFAMLGSRHNVRHWGDGAKEARISQAASRRYYYYLTADERTGDVMREVVDVDRKLMEIDPMRLASPRTGALQYPGRVRGGPDWLAMVGNWMTEWERTGDTKYRDKIVAGMDSIAAMPYGFMTGPNTLYGYDPATGKLYPLGDDPFGTYNLQVIQGGAEVAFELSQLIEHPGWDKAFLQYCRLTSAPKAVVAQDMKTGSEGADARYAGAGRLAAWAYAKTRNPAFAAKAVSTISGGGFRGGGQTYVTRKISAPDVLNEIHEYPAISTNNASQSSLNIIQVLELCKDRLPSEPPAAGVPEPRQ